MNESARTSTDYLTNHLEDNLEARKEIFLQMLQQLERVGECRAVYHRLAGVLVGDTFTEDVPTHPLTEYGQP